MDQVREEFPRFGCNENGFCFYCRRSATASGGRYSPLRSVSLIWKMYLRNPVFRFASGYTAGEDEIQEGVFAVRQVLCTDAFQGGCSSSRTKNKGQSQAEFRRGTFCSTFHMCGKYGVRFLPAFCSPAYAGCCLGELTYIISFPLPSGER